VGGSMKQFIANIQNLIKFTNSMKQQGVVTVITNQYDPSDKSTALLEIDKLFALAEHLELEPAIQIVKGKYPVEVSIESERIRYACLMTEKQAYERKVLHG